MSKRNHLEKLVRSVVHQGVQLAAFDRLLLIRAVLSSADVAGLAAILRQSKAEAYARSMNALDHRGIDHARASILLDLAEYAYGDEVPRLFDPGPIRELYTWHDWDAFMIEFHGWMTAAAGPALSLELERRAACGELSEATGRVLRELLSHASS